MLYFLSLTRKCNLKCKYCGEGDNLKEENQPRMDSNIDQVIDFLLKDPSPIIAFYGGEPLLNIPLLKKVMDSVPNSIFLLQTNGVLLHRLDDFYLNQLHTILVSIDGPPQITDYNRGEGTFQKIQDNLRIIKQKGYSGDLIARMTVSHRSNIYRDVSYLLSMESPSFDHVHWQLDVIWSPLEDWNDFAYWVDNSYNPGIIRLINKWVESIKNSSSMLGIVPFISIMNTLLSGNTVELRCGSGIDSFAIHTDGAIYGCPVCPEYEDFIVGHVSRNIPEDIYRSLLITTPCPTCEVYSICGGRCLFVNRHNFWGNSFSEVCKTVKHLISELQKKKPEIDRYIDKGIINRKEFHYPEINNSCEIIP